MRQPPRFNIKTHAHLWFFPAACIYAILIVPLTLLSRYGYGFTALITPTNHAFEMLFGFALALIAGYLLGPMPRLHLATYLLIWLLARITGLSDQASWLITVSNAIFATLLARQLLPRLWVAKKWRNQSLVPLLSLIFLIAITLTLTSQLEHHQLTRYLLFESIQLFALLMLFMGGRMLAPAVAGEFYRQGMELQARVQPKIEAGLILTIAFAFLLTPVSVSASGLLLITCGLLAMTRLLRWQLWHCQARPDLICLGIGYGWIALGLVLLGWVKLTGNSHLSAAVHAISIGALGTLACNIMIRVTLLHNKLYPSYTTQILTATGCMSAAAIMRIGADSGFYREILLVVSAISWSTSFLLVLIIILNCHFGNATRKPSPQRS